MAITIQQYIDYLKTNKRELLYKIELLRIIDETPYQTISGEIINSSGNLTINNNQGVRRSMNFDLINSNNSFINIIKNLQLGSKFKLYLGYRINGEEYFIPQGIFVFDNPSIKSIFSNRSVSITGSDKFSMLNGTNGGILESTYTVPAGSSIYDIIKQTLALSIVNDPKEPIIDSTFSSYTLPYTITKQAGDNVGDIIKEVAFAVTANIYYNTNGQFVFEPQIQDRLKGSLYDFNNLDDYNYGSGTRHYNLSDVYNSALVVSDEINGSIYRYEAINNNLADRNSVANLGFKKVKLITEYINGINSTALAQVRAEWELKLVMALLSSVDMDALPIYHLDVNQVITLTDQYIDCNDRERFLINTINFPLSTSGRMSVNMVKTSDLVI